MPTAHCVSTTDGIILAADQAFLELVGRPEHEVLGASYQSITHPDDVERSANMLVSLVKRAAPIRLQKRYIRPDGTTIPANLYVTRFDDPDRLVSTLFWNEQGRDLPPARLWEMALRVKKLREVRKAELGIELATDPVGSILNCVYLAEAEGRIVGLAEIAAECDIPPSLTGRWIDVLSKRGILETCSTPERNVQFTHDGIVKIEHVLASAYDVPLSD